jgi:hypothetical protein
MVSGTKYSTNVNGGQPWAPHSINGGVLKLPNGTKSSAIQLIGVEYVAYWKAAYDWDMASIQVTFGPNTNNQKVLVNAAGNPLKHFKAINESASEQYWTTTALQR